MGNTGSLSGRETLAIHYESSQPLRFSLSHLLIFLVLALLKHIALNEKLRFKKDNLWTERLKKKRVLYLKPNENLT